jgi:beta-galactosidase GanA
MTLPPPASAPTGELPRLVHENGRHALFVDGAPFLMLGAQCGNSSAWPATLPKVWPAVEFLHANTLEAPVSWEQFEPEPGRFDTSIIDLLLEQADAHRVKLVLLWFATWKNGSSHYMPLWMKREPEKYPRMRRADGTRVDSPSPHARATLEADKRAFQALMRHLKAVDPYHTVIMVQVQNEPGTWGSVRDFSPAAEALFQAPVPGELLKALGKGERTGSDWKAVFGRDADEFFHAWSVARFIDEIAAAGKAEYPLPLYVNAALRDPLTNPPAAHYESGGPTDNVLALWKAAAPSIDLLAPDIYMPDGARHKKVLELYSRPDNALFVPEVGSQPGYARYFFAALDRGAVGWAPFGVDYVATANAPLGAPKHNEETLAQFALNYRAVAPAMRQVARANFEGRLRAVVEEKGEPTQTLDFGRYEVVVTYGVSSFGPGTDPKGNPEPVGRALVVKLADDEYLVTGLFCRVDFRAKNARSQREYVRVEEGSYENEAFRPVRIWNGDQTDWGLNFSSAPQLIRVSLGTF